MKYIIALMSIVSIAAIAETHHINISNFKFTPNNLTINVGDTVIWTNTEGFHDVRENNDRFSSGPASSQPFTFSQTFNSVEEIFYYCTIHSVPNRDIDQNMNGRINVIEAGNTFKINQGIAGAWFFPETSGSGILIDVNPANEFMFAAWFTYEERGTQKNIGSNDNRWLTASGNYSGSTAQNLTLIQSSGGFFDDPQEVTSQGVGTMNIEFSDCNTGTVSYSFTDSNLSGSFPIQRAVPGTEKLCQSLEKTE